MLSHDIRYALRQLRKSPGFTLTAVLTLAFGIGATTAIFSIVEGVLLRPLPFADPNRLFILGDHIEGAGDAIGVPVATAPEVPTYVREMQSSMSLGSFTQTGYELSGIGEPAQINATRLSGDAFTVLGVSPVMGRTFTQAEDDGKVQVAVISYQMWRSRFHGEENILGQKILLDRKPYEIIGVMPREFEFPLVPGQLNRSELWVPVSFTPAEMVQNGSWNFNMVGRLKPGVSVAQVLENGQRTAQEIQRSFPPAMGSVHIQAAIQRLDENTVGQARPLVRTLFLAVAVVLFIACANLAGLLLVRVIRRRREIAVRLALGRAQSGCAPAEPGRDAHAQRLRRTARPGAGRDRLCAPASGCSRRLCRASTPSASTWQVVGFAFLLAIFTGLVCGFVPAFAASRTGVNDALKEGGRTGTTGGGHARLRSVLVVAELAVALVLLTGAGLLLRSFEKLRSVDLGFHTDHMLTASYGLPQQHYSTQAAVDSFNFTLLLKLRQLPGVQVAGITTILPASGQNGGRPSFRRDMFRLRALN